MRLVALCFGALAVHARLDDFYCGNSTCYEILGVDKMAKPKQIMKAFRGHSKTLHPDARRNLIRERQAEYDEALKLANGDETAVDIVVPSSQSLEDQYLMINKAYETLSNVEKRQEYDTLLNDPFRYNVMKRKYYGGGENVYVNPIIAVLAFLALGTAVQTVLHKENLKNKKETALQALFASKVFIKKCDEKLAADASLKKQMTALKNKSEFEYSESMLASFATADGGNLFELTGLDTKPLEFNDYFFMRVIMLPLTIVGAITAAATAKKTDSKKDEHRRLTARFFGLTAKEFTIACTKHNANFDYLGDEDELISKKVWTKAGAAQYKKELEDSRMADVPLRERNNVRNKDKDAQRREQTKERLLLKLKTKEE